MERRSFASRIRCERDSGLVYEVDGGSIYAMDDSNVYRLRSPLDKA